MKPARKWLQAHSYAAHLLAFSIMLATPVWMYLAVQHAAPGWIYPPLALFVIANLLELSIP